MKDLFMTPEQLAEKYNPQGDGEHPTHQRQDWRQAVSQEETLFGYWDWVAKMIWEEAQ